MRRSTHLYIDVSNTWTKFSAGTLSHLGKIQRVPTSDVTHSFAAHLHKTHRHHQLILSSVVPRKNYFFQKVWPDTLLHLVNHRSPIGLKITYPKPTQIGADRLANASAGVAFYKCPLIIVDFGTAVTFDVISAKKEYLGGAIAPGLEAMTDYLHQRTALLPRLQLREPRSAIGRSTMEAMQAGTVIGYRGLIKEILSSIQKQLRHPRVNVVATGGYAPVIAKYLPQIRETRPSLTLEGLKTIANNLDLALA